MIQSILKNKTLLLLLTVAIVLRLPLLGGSLWLDEAAQAMESSRPLQEQTNIGEDYQPPLFHIIVHFFLQVSREEWWIRLPSLIAGIGTIAILYLMLEEKYDRKVASVAALLLATSPFHIFYSQELRPYSLAAFFAILSWYVLISSRFKYRRWLWYTIVSTLGMYTMYLIPFNILAQLLYVFFEQRKSLKAVCYSLFAVGLSFLPWLPSFLTQLSIGTRLTTQLPGWSLAVATPQLKVLPLTFAKFIVGQVPLHGDPVLILFTGVLLAMSMLMIIRSHADKKARAFLYWGILPLLVAWAVSFVVPVIQPKRVLFILPALYALIAISVQKFRYRAAFFTCICALQLICVLTYWSNPILHREDWKNLVRSIDSEMNVSSVALFSFKEPFAPWQWYQTGSVRTISTGMVYIDTNTNMSSVSSQLNSVSRVYLFDYLRDLTDPAHVLEKTLTQAGFQEQGKIDGKAIGFVRIFARMN